MRQGRFVDAQTQLQLGIAMDPSFVPAYINLANLFRMQGQDKEGEKSLRNGLANAPNSAEIHHALGLALIRLKRQSDALPSLKQAAIFSPGNARFAYVYAVALQSAGQVKAAVGELDRALARHSDDYDLLVAATQFRKDQGDTAGAKKNGQVLLGLYPNDPTVLQMARELGLKSMSE